MSFVHPLVVGFLVALGVGLLIGIDRERNKGDGATRQPAGLRTFTLASLLGATAMAVGDEILLAAVALGMVAFAGLSYWRARDGDPGLTTETALVLTTLLGGLAIKHPEFAAGLGVVVAVLLAARSALHRFVRSVLTDDELRDLLIFAAATLVVLPLLPDKPIGPYGALNLRTVWTIVILVMAVSALGYVAVRVVGPRYGLPLAGLASGFVSSSATIGAMGTRAKDEPALMKPAVAGAVLSSVATVVQLAILIAATNMPTLQALWLPLVLSGAAAVALWRRLHPVGAEAEDPEARNAGQRLQPHDGAHLCRHPGRRAAGRRRGAGLVRRGGRPDRRRRRRLRRHALGRRVGRVPGQRRPDQAATDHHPGAGGLHHQHRDENGLRRDRRRPPLRALRHPRPAADAGSRLGRCLHRLSVRTAGLRSAAPARAGPPSWRSAGVSTPFEKLAEMPLRSASDGSVKARVKLP